MEKKIKKIRLHPHSIHREFGREYQHEVPEFHIEGKECSERAYHDYLADAQRKEFKWRQGDIFKKEKGAEAP